jgi:hypothetical protein
MCNSNATPWCILIDTLCCTLHYCWDLTIIREDENDKSNEVAIDSRISGGIGHM